MPESIFPIDFPKCPFCGSTETLAPLVLKEKEQRGFKEETPFPALTKMLAPLIPIEKAVGITLPMITLYKDICAGCGIERCTRADIADVPITMAPPPGGGMGGPPGFRPGAHGPFNLG
jgi:hypothetical protein